LLLQIATMLAAALALSSLVRRWLPALAAEIAAGILLGPTLFGAWLPNSQEWLFPTTGPVASGRQALVMLGLLAFLFAAGLELNVSLIARRVRAVVATSLLGIVVPFALGGLAVYALPRFWSETEPANIHLLAAMVGTALSISALPVIARILADLRLQHTPTAAVVLSAATIDDLIGWSLLATLLVQVEGGRLGSAWVPAILGLISSVAVITLVRPWLARLGARLPPHLRTPLGFVAASAVLGLLAAAATEGLGLHALFGAFLAGIAMGGGTTESSTLHQPLRTLALGVGAPLYFVSLGLRVNFLEGFDPWLVIVVLAVACLGKVSGASLGAWWGGMAAREAWAVGWGMNARGAMEVVLASVALEHHLIDRRLFVALVFMAVATSAVSGPAMRRLLAPRDARAAS
jgi:Kef-type K+ transport system membrane component KefB